MLHPTQTNDLIKITGVTNKPDATNEKIMACGTLWDDSANEYLIFVLNVRTDAFRVDDKISWRMIPSLTEDVNPDIYLSNAEYLVWWQLSNKEIYIL